MTLRRLALPLLFSLCAMPAAATGLDAATTAKIDAVFADFTKPGSPGCALGVYERGTLLYAKGYGLASIEHGVAIDPRRTVFDLGSTSKQFTAASVLLLARDGKLQLDDSVRKHLPQLPAYFDAVTLQHLLNHTAGVRDYIALLMMGGTSVEDHTTDDDALAAIVRQTRLDFAPGSEHSYSNSGYFLLSLVVKQVAGKPLRDFAQERIFTPLGMRDTLFIDDHTRVIAHKAASYEGGPEGSFVLSTSGWEQTGDGAVLSTVADLAKWDANFHAPKVGDAAFVAQLQQVGVLDDGEALTYARGLLVDTHRGLQRVSHGGSWMGFRSDLARYPATGIGAAALCNTGTANPTALLTAVADIVLADQLQPLPPPPAHEGATPATTPAAASAFNAAAYVGTYYNAAQALVRRIELRDGKLWYVRRKGNESELAFEGDHRFRMLGVPGSAVLTFVPQAVGQRQLTLVSDGDTTELREVAAFAPDAQSLAAYTGAFDSAELDTRWHLALDGDALTLRGRRGEPQSLAPAFPDAFTGPGVLLRFQRDAGGQVTGIEVDAGRARGMGFRRVWGSSQRDESSRYESAHLR